MDVDYTQKLFPSVPSSPFSEFSSSDSETCNTSTSRVHFGPLRSPEKRFIATGHQQKILLSTPLHSQHLPESLPDAPHIHGFRDGPHDQQDDNQEDCLSQSHSRSGTPENIQFPPDEPSSVLASRIIRAYDNPSPPPRMVGTLHGPIQVDKDVALSPIGILPPFPASSALVVAQDHEELQFPLPPPSPSPSPFSRNQASLVELFRDSVNLSSSPKKESCDSHSRGGLVSCDFFAASPAYASQPETEYSTNSQSFSKPEDNVIKGIAPDFSTRESLQDVLTPTLPSDGQGNTLSEAIGFRVGQSDSWTLQEYHGDVSYFVDPPTTPVRDEGRSQSPIRRSTRPRRGASPFLTNGSSSTPNMRLLQHADGLLTVPSPAQTQKKKKDRSVSPANASDLDTEDRNRSTTTIADSVDPLANEQERDGSKRRGKRREINSTESTVKTGNESPLRRQLGSLSPLSADVLTQLIPSTDVQSTPTDDLQVDKPTLPGTEPPYPPEFVFPLVSQPYTSTMESESATRSSSPVRFSSPNPSTRRSPVKIQPMDIDDPNRTPARRIPLEQAVAQGQISLQKAMQLASRPPDRPSASQALFPQRTPIFPFLPELQSPARRIPVSEATPVKSRGPMSPIRAPVKERSRSVEPRSLQTTTTTTRIVRSASVDFQKPPTTAGATSDTQPRVHALLPISKSVSQPQLPYPLTPLREHPILEEVEPQSYSASEPVKSDIAKVKPTTSKLKQASTVSRIPRIGIKPYAKPAAIAATTTSSKAKEGRTPGIMRRVDLTLNLNHGTTSGHPRPAPASASIGSNFAKSSSSGDASVSDSFDHSMPVTSGRNLAGTSTSPLKRKRGPEIATSPVKGTSARVVPVNCQQQLSKHLPGDMRGSPLKKKKNTPVFLRKVVDHPKEVVREEEYPQAVSQPNGSDEGETPITTIDKNTQLSTSHPTEACAPIVVNDTSTTPPPNEISNTESIPNSDLDFGRNHRTTRPRKVASTNSLVNVFETSNRSRINRRRVALTSYESDVFSGMSAVELRALTSSNTTRNQVYWTTKLETEVIRKEGARPDSPIVKVKTIMQRREEEKTRQRQERAARRARRSDEISDFNDADGFQNAQPLVTDADSDLDEQDTCHLLKHQRGPGDDEDYQTPNRGLSAKRQSSGEEEDDVEKKRVKWDHSLSTAVFVDDVLPRPRARPRGVTVKGCLAKTAKALRLDNLGNLPNADTPLVDLVHENIVVKKYVYDNDPLTLGPTAKNPKSRSKKARS